MYAIVDVEATSGRSLQMALLKSPVYSLMVENW
jgi:hypothetical protein